MKNNIDERIEMSASNGKPDHIVGNDYVEGISFKRQESK